MKLETYGKKNLFSLLASEFRRFKRTGYKLYGFAISRSLYKKYKLIMN